jgi:hypothetical protein
VTPSPKVSKTSKFFLNEYRQYRHALKLKPQDKFPVPAVVISVLLEAELDNIITRRDTRLLIEWGCKIYRDRDPEEMTTAVFETLAKVLHDPRRS